MTNLPEQEMPESMSERFGAGWNSLPVYRAYNKAGAIRRTGSSEGRPRLIFLWRETLALLIVMAVYILGGTIGGLVTGFAMALWGLRSSKAAMQSMTLLVLFTYISHIFSHHPLDSTLKWIVLLFASGAAIHHCLRHRNSRRQLTIPSWLLTFLLFFIVTLLAALVCPTSPELAVFKLLTFAIGVLGTMAIFYDNAFDPGYGLSWFYTVFLFVVFASAPLTLVKIGYIPGSSLFIGILNQSQAYGIYIVPFLTVLLISWLSGSVLISLEGKVGCILGVITLYLSHSRTAAYALLMTVPLIFIIGYLRGRKDRRLLSRALLSVCFVVLLIVVFNMLSPGQLAKLTTGFTNKYGVAVKNVLGSRELKVDEALAALHAHPLTGVGFGMNLDQTERQDIELDPYFGLPVSAPVEASVMYVALPAQVGIIGLIPFLAFLITYALPIIRHAPLPLLGLFLCTFFVNFGEYIFFAIGGIGLASWCYFALAHRFSVLYGQSHDY